MIIHTVTPGETVYTIASLYGVSASQIIEDNQIENPENLVQGQALLILRPTEFYTVKEGDTLSSIAAEKGISLRQLYRNNPSLINDPDLFPGKTLVLSYEGEQRGELVTVGYAYPFIPPQTASQSLPYLSDLSVFTYGFDTEGALVPPQADDRAFVTQITAAGTAPILVLSTLGPDGTFDNRLSSSLFASPEAEERLTRELLAVMAEKGYEGLDIDFEYVDPTDKEAYAAFIRRITERMNAEGYEVIVALAPKTSATQQGLLYEAHDYRALGAAANAVLLMTYEWGYSLGPPMAVAPIDKVRQVVDYALTEIPSEKIFLGIPNYGYDWTLPYTPGTPATSLSPQRAVELAGQYRAEILFDQQSASPYFYYTDETGQEHVVWFEDARSFLSKLDLISEKQLTGLSVWTVMTPAKTLFLEANNLFEIL